MNLSDINIKSPLFSGSRFFTYNHGYIYNIVYIYIHIWHTAKWQQSLKPRNLFQLERFIKCKCGKYMTCTGLMTCIPKTTLFLNFKDSPSRTSYFEHFNAKCNPVFWQCGWALVVFLCETRSAAVPSYTFSTCNEDAANERTGWEWPEDFLPAMIGTCDKFVNFPTVNNDIVCKWINDGTL